MRKLGEGGMGIVYLAHPNIARLLDGGTTESRAPYLFMEYLQGEPIDAHCREHELARNGVTPRIGLL